MFGVCLMRWTTELEHHILDKLAEGTCPLCGGRVKVQRRRVYAERGQYMDYVEPVCVACGMVVGGGDMDGDF